MIAFGYFSEGTCSGHDGMGKEPWLATLACRGKKLFSFPTHYCDDIVTIVTTTPPLSSLGSDQDIVVYKSLNSLFGGMLWLQFSQYYSRPIFCEEKQACWISLQHLLFSC